MYTYMYTRVSLSGAPVNETLVYHISVYLFHLTFNNFIDVLHVKTKRTESTKGAERNNFQLKNNFS